VDLKRGPLSLVNTTEGLLERESSCWGLENQDCGRRESAALTATHPYPQKLPLTSPTSGDHSVGVVRSRTQTTEFVFCFWSFYIHHPISKFYTVPRPSNNRILGSNPILHLSVFSFCVVLKMSWILSKSYQTSINQDS
jgi:hypothetical protein